MTCEVCGGPIPETARTDAATCSARCRKRKSRAAAKDKPLTDEEKAEIRAWLRKSLETDPLPIPRPTREQIDMHILRTHRKT